MSILIATFVVAAAGYWLSSGGFQAWIQNHNGWFESPLEMLSRPIFLVLMLPITGLLYLLLAVFFYWRAPEGEAWLLTAAWTTGWWIGQFLGPRLSDEQREWLRRKLGGKSKK